MDTSTKEHLESIRNIRAVPVKRQMTSREHREDSWPENLLEVSFGTSEQPEVKSRDINSSTQSGNSSQGVAKIFKDERSNYLLLKQNTYQHHYIFSQILTSELKMLVGCHIRWMLYTWPDIINLSWQFDHGSLHLLHITLPTLERLGKYTIPPHQEGPSTSVVLQ